MGARQVERLLDEPFAPFTHGSLGIGEHLSVVTEEVEVEYCNARSVRYRACRCQDNAFIFMPEAQLEPLDLALAVEERGLYLGVRSAEPVVRVALARSAAAAKDVRQRSSRRRKSAPENVDRHL
jgi:hypothetical protein